MYRRLRPLLKEMLFARLISIRRVLVMGLNNYSGIKYIEGFKLYVVLYLE